MFKFFQKKKQKQKSEPNPPVLKLTSEQKSILDILDYAATDYIFPMLDNGYYYLAASRLSLFRDDTDWAMVFEIFAFSPRAGMPDLFVSTISSKPDNREQCGDFVNEEAFENYMQAHPNTEQRTFFPIESETWMDAEDTEIVALEENNISGKLVLRGQNIKLPSLQTIRNAGYRESEEELFVFEMCRYLADAYRQDVLATPDEQRVNIAPNMERILVLDDWYHPDLVDGEKPSDTETFRQLADVLATGDLAKYMPVSENNTHWKNWPEGGTL